MAVFFEEGVVAMVMREIGRKLIILFGGSFMIFVNIMYKESFF